MEDQDPDLARLFKLLAQWRKFPAYALERRADIFFALYLNEILTDQFKEKYFDLIIPEFPLLKSRVRDKDSDPIKPIVIGAKHSVKADYLCLDTRSGFAVIVELKTDESSSRSIQLDDMIVAGRSPLHVLLQDVVYIRSGSKSKRKYDQLFTYLKDHGGLMVKEGREWKSSITGDRNFKDIGLMVIKPDATVIKWTSVQRHKIKVMCFSDVSKVISKQEGKLARRLSQALDSEWTT